MALNPSPPQKEKGSPFPEKIIFTRTCHDLLLYKCPPSFFATSERRPSPFRMAAIILQGSRGFPLHGGTEEGTPALLASFILLYEGMLFS